MKLSIQTLFALATIIQIGSSAPGQIVQANLRMWFDASDAATITLDTTGTTTVSDWVNKAVSGGHIFNGAKEQQPLWLPAALNGHPAMQFDGSNDVLRNTAFSNTPMSEATIFFVFAPLSDNGGFPSLLSFSTNDADDYLTGLNVDLGQFFQSSFSYFNIEGPKLRTPGGTNYRNHSGPFGVWHLIQVNYWSTRLELIVDGVRENRVTLTAPAPINIQNVRIGGRYYAGGERGYGNLKMAEVVVYDSAADCDSLNQTALYLANKYGISTAYLPPGCPADFNADCTLDFFDYLDFVDAFGSNSSAADFNHDGVIDFFDYLDFVDAFSGGC